MPHLVCAVLDNAHEAATPKARDLTISWLRWGYFGRIVAGQSVDAILQEAVAGGYEYCLLQGAGHIIVERGGVCGNSARSFYESLERWIAQRDFFVAGKDVRRGAGLNRRCLLVNLRYYERFGGPRFETAAPGSEYVGLSGRHAAPIVDFDQETGDYLRDLGANLEWDAETVRSFAQAGDDSQRGIFILNFESYLDVETPPADFTGPLRALYSVAAGFKSNRILETHGFEDGTRVVYFDYSAAGLEFRKQLLGDWDGRDYPSFLRTMFRRIPPTGAHYYLWHGASPDAMDWDEMDRLWKLETDRWGGADAFAAHWVRYRALPHEFVLTNLFQSREELLRRIGGGEEAIWWSNAFSTVYSAWHFSIEEKRQAYESWIQELASRAPRLLIYGSDHSNSSVNSMRAGEYWPAYQAEGGDPLAERKFCRQRIRF